MTWSYSGDPSTTPKDKVRFLIGDTEQNDPLLQDEEINFALTLTSDDAAKAAVKCCEAALAKVSKSVDYEIGPESVKASQRAEGLKDLLRRLKGSVTSSPSMATPHAQIFSVDIMSNK